NQVGGHADLIFDGRSLVLDANGEIRDELPAFEEGIHCYTLHPSGEIGLIPTPSSTASSARETTDSGEETADSIALVYRALRLGIRAYFDKSGFQKAVLGLSGGLDSAGVAALACEALGAERVVAILMPSEYSSDHAPKHALALIRN